MKGVSKVFWLSRDEFSGHLAAQSTERGYTISLWGTIAFRALFGRLFLRLGQKAPFRLITEERYQELLVGENRKAYREERREERYARALRVIHTWASFEDGRATTIEQIAETAWKALYPGEGDEQDDQ